MNNLYRELAPINESAWTQIEEEAARTLKRYLAARRVVDVKGPGGSMLSAVGTGHVRSVDPPAEGIIARQRDVKALVELRVPFQLDRQAIDDVERGANDSDWASLKDAAKKIAFAEDRAIFEGYAAASIDGIRQGSSNRPMTLPPGRCALPRCDRRSAESVAIGGRQRTLFSVAGRRCLHGAERGQRSWLSGDSAYRAPC